MKNNLPVSLIYTVFAEIYLKKKKFNKSLKYISKAVKHDMSPVKKLIDYDALVLKTAEAIYKEEGLPSHIEINKEAENVLILNTEIYDSGGHTEIALRYIEKYRDKQNIYFVLTRPYITSNETAPNKSAVIKSLVKDYFEFEENYPDAKKVIDIFNYIIDHKINKIITNFHMWDSTSAAITALVKRHTDIPVEFWNHGDHWFSLGTKYADIIYTRVKNGKALTPYLKDNPKCTNGKFTINYDKNLILSKDEINCLKAKLNIPSDCFLTMTGCILHKLDNKYFNLINKLLKADDKIYHLFICPDYPLKEKKIKKLFKNNKRVILMPGTNEFEKYIQISDLYVDSFPQGSALTLIDFIKYKKPVVIKINEKEPIRSFEEYLYPNYKYAFKTSKGMLNGILELANDKEKYNETSNNVWEFFEKEYINTGT